MVLNAIGINREEFLAFIATKMPSYVDLEAWILEKSGGAIDPETIDYLNRTIAGYDHRAETRKAILDDCGVADNGAVIDALTLNNLDDWNTFYDAHIA